jgi:hypothetical protein
MQPLVIRQGDYVAKLADQLGGSGPDERRVLHRRTRSGRWALSHGDDLQREQCLLRRQHDEGGGPLHAVRAAKFVRAVAAELGTKATQSDLLPRAQTYLGPQYYRWASNNAAMRGIAFRHAVPRLTSIFTATAGSPNVGVDFSPAFSAKLTYGAGDTVASGGHIGRMTYWSQNFASAMCIRGCGYGAKDRAPGPDLGGVLQLSCHTSPATVRPTGAVAVATLLAIPAEDPNDMRTKPEPTLWRWEPPSADVVTACVCERSWLSRPEVDASAPPPLWGIVRQVPVQADRPLVFVAPTHGASCVGWLDRGDGQGGTLRWIH